MSNCPNLAQTAAIDVLFSINYAVVLDLIYFRFWPSKAKTDHHMQPRLEQGGLGRDEERAEGHGLVRHTQ